ncbi:MAG: FkbM family methyltransferase [Rhodospirillales bacterium]|nr:FkbM family methyltransferase [Rhodospirillales bacterium]
MVAKLHRAGFHQYRKRWTKRLFKKPGRALFDLAYGLGLRGEGRMILDLPGGPREFRFDGRHAHFGMIYQHPDHLLFEAGVAALLDAFMTGSRVFYDGGANWGWASLYAATLPRYHGPIHAFEPVPVAYRDLAAVVAELNLAARITCHNVALSDRTGAGRMVQPDPLNTGWARVTDAGGFEVRLAELDGLDLPDPDFIKLDVEGHEYRVLKGARQRLIRGRPHVILENWLELDRPDLTAAPLRFLEAAGYSLYVPCWQRTVDGAPFVWPEPHPPTPSPDQVFVLVPVTSDQRFLMARHLSIYGCPAERKDELRRVFEEVPR